MLHNSYEIRVLVKGRPINEYSHNGQVFIEGRDGSNFEIEFLNRTNTRVEAVISVDGLSVIDGKDAGPQSSGYLVDAFGSVRIPGWKLTDEQVAAFVFAGKKKSYAQASTGSARNTGVLGAMVFAEKPVYRPTHTYAYPNAAFPNAYPLGGGVLRGMVPTSGGWAGGGSTGDVVCSGSFADASITHDSFQMTSLTSLNNMSYSSSETIGAAASASAAPRARETSRRLSKAAAPQQAKVEQTLGTAFGAAQSFETTTVEFNRGELKSMIVMYYDDSRGLRARGIELARPSRQRYARNEAPQAFPGMNTGCAPPPGWKG